MAARAIFAFTLLGSVAATRRRLFAADSLYDLSAVDIDGRQVSLNFDGNVTVVINVATE